MFLFLMGIAFGAIAVKTLSQTQITDLSAYLEDFFRTFPNEITHVNRPAIVLRGILDNILKISGLVWVLGLTIIGVPVILAIIFVRGFVLGFTIGFMVSDMHLSGLVVAAASVLPHNLLVIPALLLSATTAISFAISAVKTLIGISPGNILLQFLATTIIVLCTSGLLVLAAIVEMYVTPYLMQLSQGLLL